MARNPLPAARITRIEEMAETLRYATWDALEPAGEPTFHIFGVEGPKSRPDFSGYRHLIVSPFVNDGGLGVVAPDGRSSAITLLSRAEQMDRLSPSTIDRLYETFIVSPLAGLSAAAEPDMVEGDEPLEASEGSGHAVDQAEDSLLGGGLHAKLYVVERNRAAHVFIGSANATDAAFDGNVEILLEFSAGATKMGVDTFLDKQAGMSELLEPYDTQGGEQPDPEEEALAQLEYLLRRVATMQWTVSVADGEEPFTLDCSVAGGLALPDDITERVALLSQPGRSHSFAGEAHVRFEAVPLADVTPFVTVTLTRKGADVGELQAATVIRARLVNDPEGRLDAVLARQVDTPEKFLRFLLLLLGLDATGTADHGAGDGHGSWGLAGQVGTLEAIVKALAEHPSAIVELDRLVSRLRRTEEGRRILPDGFEALWSEVLTAHRSLPRILTGRGLS